MKNIFIDFDGTIINDKKKQYKAFYKTVNTLNVHNDLDFETFLKLKSNHLSNYEVLQSVSKTSINKFEFNKIYKTHVEKIQLLYEDKLFEDALNLLKSIYEKGYKCYLVTNGPGTESNEPTSGLDKKYDNFDFTKEESEAGYKNFCVIKCKIESIEWLYLAAKGHRRALLDFNGSKKFTWLVP